ncbi:molecular chaperone DnaJ [Serratia sp. 201]|uniref:molecular chaperone DnaJ n=1 Tax=Serratia sp. 201 TaxID=3096764 RepID=UPI00300AF602
MEIMTMQQTDGITAPVTALGRWSVGKSAGLTACPHCGGENGYHTKEIVDFKQFYDWSGEFQEGQHTSGIRSGKAFYCCDCGRNITKHVKVQQAEAREKAL